MYNANVTMLFKNIPVYSEEECKKWLEEYFQELAGSNDGSEFLANLLSGGFVKVDLDIFEKDELR